MLLSLGFIGVPSIVRACVKKTQFAEQFRGTVKKFRGTPQVPRNFWGSLSNSSPLSFTLLACSMSVWELFWNSSAKSPPSVGVVSRSAA